MLIAGSLAWFNSRKSVDFSNQVRQIESEIRSIQSESSSNKAPNGGASFASGEELFGAAVGITPENLATPQTTMRVYYLKQTAPGATGQSEGIASYSSREIQLPATLYLAGYQNIAPNDSVCSNKVKPKTAGVGVTNVAQQSLIVFRQISGSYNAFSRPDSATVAPQLIGGPRVPWGGTVSSTPGWRGSYDDESYNYSTGSGTGPLASQPCAVLWRFESVERSGANPRFSAEIQFNLVDGTTTVQTR
jgi:hypothetical protein